MAVLKELSDENLSQVTGGETVDCAWGESLQYQLVLGKAYCRNRAYDYVYVPLSHVSSPQSGCQFHVFSCEYYEKGSFKDVHNVSFGKNDIIEEAVNFVGGSQNIV